MRSAYSDVWDSTGVGSGIVYVTAFECTPLERGWEQGHTEWRGIAPLGPQLA